MSLSIFSQEFILKGLNLFGLQYSQNLVYQQFCNALGRNPGNVTDLYSIPFMPIEFFKNHKIYTGKNAPELEFKSSGTTGMDRSTHYIDFKRRYDKSLIVSYKSFFKSGEPLSLFALLPGYVENQNSSLIYMLERMNDLGLLHLKGYYLENHEKLINNMEAELAKNRKVLLWGVTFGLLDFAEKGGMDLSGQIVLETGGMKGRRREMTRNEVHEQLCKAFNVEYIYSEYGMTELLSQAYSSGEGIFNMHENFGVLARDVYDPLTILEPEKNGALNIIDLHNEHSCAFIATQDLGRYYANETFEVLGRTDNSEVRGCNLLAI